MSEAAQSHSTLRVTRHWNLSWGLLKACTQYQPGRIGRKRIPREALKHITTFHCYHAELEEWTFCEFAFPQHLIMIQDLDLRTACIRTRHALTYHGRVQYDVVTRNLKTTHEAAAAPSLRILRRREPVSERIQPRSPQDWVLWQEQCPRNMPVVYIELIDEKASNMEHWTLFLPQCTFATEESTVARASDSTLRFLHISFLSERNVAFWCDLLTREAEAMGSAALASRLPFWRTAQHLYLEWSSTSTLHLHSHLDTLLRLAKRIRHPPLAYAALQWLLPFHMSCPFPQAWHHVQEFLPTHRRISPLPSQCHAFQLIQRITTKVDASPASVHNIPILPAVLVHHILPKWTLPPPQPDTARLWLWMCVEMQRCRAFPNTVIALLLWMLLKVPRECLERISIPHLRILFGQAPWVQLLVTTTYPPLSIIDLDGPAPESLVELLKHDPCSWIPRISSASTFWILLARNASSGYLRFLLHYTHVYQDPYPLLSILSTPDVYSDDSIGGQLRLIQGDRIAILALRRALGRLTISPHTVPEMVWDRALLGIVGDVHLLITLLPEAHKVTGIEDFVTMQAPTENRIVTMARHLYLYGETTLRRQMMTPYVVMAQVRSLLLVQTTLTTYQRAINLDDPIANFRRERAMRIISSNIDACLRNDNESPLDTLPVIHLAPRTTFTQTYAKWSSPACNHVLDAIAASLYAEAEPDTEEARHVWDLAFYFALVQAIATPIWYIASFTPLYHHWLYRYVMDHEGILPELRRPVISMLAALWSVSTGALPTWTDHATPQDQETMWRAWLWAMRIYVKAPARTTRTHLYAGLQLPQCICRCGRRYAPNLPTRQLPPTLIYLCNATGGESTALQHIGATAHCGSSDTYLQTLWDTFRPGCVKCT